MQTASKTRAQQRQTYVYCLLKFVAFMPARIVNKDFRFINSDQKNSIKVFFYSQSSINFHCHPKYKKAKKKEEKFP